MNTVVYHYQLRQLFRSRTLLIALSLLLASGIYSAYYGKHFVAQQQKVLHGVDTLEQGKLIRHQEYLSQLPDSVNQGNRVYLGSPVVKYAPTAFTSLAIGQKDNYPFYHDLNSPSIYHTASTKIQNPVKLLAGNFDLSFVIVYLLPLFIVVLGYNVLSEEKELHTATLLMVQANLKGIIGHKLIFRMLLMMVLSVVMNICGFLINGISISEIATMASWMLISLVYIAFWFSLVYLVISFDRPGSVNALILGGLWVLLLIIVPAMVNRQVSIRHDKEQVQMMFNDREDTLDPYKLSEKELRDSFNLISHKYKLPDTTDTSRLGRTKVKSLMVGIIKKRAENKIGRIALENTYSEYQHALAYNFANPAFAVQTAFNKIGNSEISNFWAYMNTLEEFETERNYFLHRYYKNRQDFDFQEDPQPQFKFKQATTGLLSVLVMIWPVILIMLLIVLLARRILNS